MSKKESGIAHILVLVAAVGIIAFLLISNTFSFKDTLFNNLFPRLFSRAATITDLAQNGGFESGNLNGWTHNGGTIVVNNTNVHSGNFSLQVGPVSGGANTVGQIVNLVPGKSYKATAWVYLKNISGGSWGGPTLDVSGTAQGQFDLITRTNLLQDYVPFNTWTKVGVNFTAQINSNLVVVGATGDKNFELYFDDIQVFEATLNNSIPTANFTSNTSNVTSIPGSVTFSSSVDDSDGLVEYLFWDFGDGGRSNVTNPTHAYISNGTYTAKLVAYDDSGGNVQASKTITVSDPSYPNLSITNPPTTITSSTLTLTGTASVNGSSISKVEYSTDRGLKGSATGTASWTANINLAGFTGPNRILINAFDSSGKVAKKEIVVNYTNGKVDVVNGASGITQNSNQVEKYDKFEATFNLQNGSFTNPYFPYETSSEPGMAATNGTGVNVAGIFTSPTGKQYTQPAFYYQPYQRVQSTQQLLPTGSPVWKLRFAPNEVGVWTYKVSITDASGSTTISDNTKLTFNAVNPTVPNNHGFLHPSTKDTRYFEFSDGTPFIGVGPTAFIDGNNSFNTDTNIAKVAADSANLSRTWMSGNNVAGSSWAPWTAGIDSVGNYPGVSLTTDEAYGNGYYSLTLPHQGPGARQGSAGRCVFYGFTGVTSSVKPNTNYRVLVRLKTIVIPNTGGFNLRIGNDWPGNGCDGYSGTSPFGSPESGTKDWHVLTGNWNSASNTKLGNLLVTLENVSAGRVYIDEISIKEDLGNGSFGPEVLPRSSFNVQNYFSQEPSWNWDYGLDEFAKKGMYDKIVIEEKGDFSYNYISPYGFGYELGNKIGYGASMKYQEYFWRYLIARYGYSRAVHSFEYANEQAPGDLAAARALAAYVHANDPQKHMAAQSPWCCIDTNHTYQWGEIDYADTHAYSGDGMWGTTSWLGTTDPTTGGSIVNDSTLFAAAHSLSAFSANAASGKPIIMGEAGISIASGNLALGATDSFTSGEWLHQFIWPQMNPGGMYFIYWDNTTINSHNLYPMFTTYRHFMEGQSSDTVNKRIPLNNGKYTDIGLTLPTGVRGWGQKDIVNGGAHFWVYDIGFTWASPNGGSSLGGKSVSFSGLPAKTYTVEFWNTWTGAVTAQTVNHPGGTMTLTIPSGFTQKDAAIKVLPQSGYPGSSTPNPSPTPTPTPSSIPGDIDKNGKVDIFDFNYVITDFGKSDATSLRSDLNASGTVDIFDFNTVITNFGRTN